MSLSQIIVEELARFCAKNIFHIHLAIIGATVVVSYLKGFPQ